MIRRLFSSGTLQGALLLASLLLRGVSLSAQNDSATHRQDLKIPDSLWSRALAGIGARNGVIGYSADEMLNYNPDDLVLRSIWELSRDVRNVPRYSGQISGALLDNAGDPAAVIRIAYGLTDISAGRNLPPALDSLWHASPSTRHYVNADAALDSMLAGARNSGFSAKDRAIWKRLPDRVKLFAVRLYDGASEAATWFDGAYPDSLILPALGVSSPERATAERLYSLAIKPWFDERQGQPATHDRYIFEIIHRTDRRRVAFASAIMATYLQAALTDLLAADTSAPVDGSFFSLAIPTRLGMLAIHGTRDDTISGDAFLTIDLGGNDHYSGRQGTPLSLARPIGIVVDLAGDDTYDEPKLPAAMGCGLFGFGAIIDVAGNDYYRIRESGLGAGWFGTGLLMDMAGDDQYIVDSTWGQGTAHIGVGALVDLAGNDRYTCGSQAQGLGCTLGAGVLLDRKGNDRYIARDDGAISELYLNQSVSMAQGVGYGRRADLGDGHSLAGGVGMLVDGAGDDYYSAPVWSQGAGYWWGFGALEDRAGNDTYRSGKYSIGSAAHFAIGCKVDLAGNDSYSIGYDSAKNQYNGHARDGSIGISIDGGGNDRYFLKSNCAGSADLNSIALFWDRGGDDEYNIYYPKSTDTGWSDTPPLGTATLYPPFNTFRDELPSYGLFIDGGGQDRYIWDDRGGSIFHWDTMPGNRKEWRSRRSKTSLGFGMDGE
ncbi:MAG: hypothetical protein ABIR47_03565 [Candidatus Kapaibacterium sp.]